MDRLRSSTAFQVRGATRGQGRTHGDQRTWWRGLRIADGRKDKNTGDTRGTSGIRTLTVRFHQGYESTQPPEALLNALLHNDCTGKVAPVDKVTSAAAPCPEEIQAHLSPFSAPLESSQPPFGNWSVIVSAIS